MPNLSNFFGAVKSVQRGLIHQYIYEELSCNMEWTISPVNLNKAILLITSIGPSKPTIVRRFDGVTFSLSAADTIRATGFPPGRSLGGGVCTTDPDQEVDYYLDISWQVIEFY